MAEDVEGDADDTTSKAADDDSRGLSRPLTGSGARGRPREALGLSGASDKIHEALHGSNADGRSHSRGWGKLKL